MGEQKDPEQEEEENEGGEKRQGHAILSPVDFKRSNLINVGGKSANLLQRDIGSYCPIGDTAAV